MLVSFHLSQLELSKHQVVYQTSMERLGVIYNHSHGSTSMKKHLLNHHEHDILFDIKKMQQLQKYEEILQYK